jgi:hypothetical protein
MGYEPTPIDTSKVSLTPEIGELVEMLARDVHEVWAQQRLSQGWRHGPERDDFLKEHPCLIPYEELPEQEKEMDRQVALQVIKAMLAYGCQIQAPSRAVE